jgi:hypothetical protein
MTIARYSSRMWRMQECDPFVSGGRRNGNRFSLAQTFTSGATEKAPSFLPPAPSGAERVSPLKGLVRKRNSLIGFLPTGVNAWAREKEKVA